MKVRPFLLILIFLLMTIADFLQAGRILFDYTKNETAGNADWVVDHNYPYPLPAAPISPTDWDGAISSWGYYLYRLGHQIVTLTPSYGITYGNSSNPLDLSNFDVFIMPEPQNPLTSSEKTAILNFIYNGGGFFMVADHNSSDRDGDGWDSPRVFNDAFENVLGVHFNVTGERPNSYSGISSNISYFDSIINGYFGRVNTIGFWSGTCITLRTNINPNVFGLIWVPGALPDNDSIMFFYGYYGRGRFVGIGDSSPCDDGTGNPSDDLYNNWSMYSDSALILNATLWLLYSGSQSLSEKSHRLQRLVIVAYDEALNLVRSGYIFYNANGQEVTEVKPGLYFAKSPKNNLLKLIVK